MKSLGNLDSKIIPITVKIIAPRIDPSYIMIAIAGIDKIGFPPVMSGYASSVPAVINSAIVNPHAAPIKGHLYNLCCGSASPKVTSGYGVPVRMSYSPSPNPASLRLSRASAAESSSVYSQCKVLLAITSLSLNGPYGLFCSNDAAILP